MREEAPVYYNEEHDFYALVPARGRSGGVQGPRDVLVGVRRRPGAGQSRRTDTVKMIIVMDPPEHRQMRSLVNKVFTPRAIEAMRRDGHRDHRPLHLDQSIPIASTSYMIFRRSSRFEVITQMLGVPEEHRQQVRGWVDSPCVGNPVKSRCPTTGMQAVADIMGLYYNLIQQRRAEPRDDMFSRLLETEVEREDGQKESPG